MGQQTIENAKKYANKQNLDLFYFKLKDKNGKTIDIDGIVSPLERDNRDLVTPIEDQGNAPFCAAFSVCTIFESMHWKKTGKLVNIDQDHVYARAKQIDKNSDDGTYLESAVKACSELLGFDSKAVKLQTYYNYKNNETILRLKHLIHKYDLVHAGFMITTNWFNCSQNDYIIKDGGSNAGGHAVVIDGYDPSGVFICNSWGKHWGSMGHAILPWSLVLKQLMYVAVFDVPELKI